MTPEEIKNLIASAIAGQGNQVDSGGALSTILNAIVDATPKPIEITGTLSEDISTQAELDAIGLTLDEIKAAAEGKRTCVIYRQEYYNIASATFTSNSTWNLRFLIVSYDGAAIDSIGGWELACIADNLYITEIVV